MRLKAFFDTLPGGGTEEKPDPDIMVTFDGQTWYGTAVLGARFSDWGYPVLQLMAVQSTQGLPLPMAGLNVPTATGAYASHGDTVYSCFYMPSGSADTVVFNGQTYPRWIALADADSVYCKGTVTALDLTAHTVSLDMSARMLDVAAYAASGTRTVRDMAVRLSGITFSPQSGL